jgi:hypothetical protein
MTQRYLESAWRSGRRPRWKEFASATALACVTATLLATAQTAPPRPADGRDVTAVGCLKRERDIHGRMTTGGSEAGTPGEAFVLTNARITSASMPQTPTASTERERQTAPSGSPGVSGAGTSGTENTSVQATDRPPSDAARGGATAANPPGGKSETMYKVVGLPDGELRKLLGQQVEVRATLDANTMGSAALRQPGATMGREPASTPSASTPPPSPTQAPPTEADRQDSRPPTATLPELKATSIRAAGGRCQGT